MAEGRKQGQQDAADASVKIVAMGQKVDEGNLQPQESNIVLSAWLENGRLCRRYANGVIVRDRGGVQ